MIDHVELRQKSRQQGKDTLDLGDVSAGHPVAEAELEYLEARCEKAEAERNRLSAKVERQREAVTDLLGVIELDSEVEPDNLMVAAAREVLNETGRVSLAHVRADAIEAAASRALATVPWSNVSEAGGWRRACSYIRGCAMAHRQSTNQSGEDDG